MNNSDKLKSSHNRLFIKVTRDTLPQVKDKYPFVYLERGRLEIDGSSVKWIDSDGNTVDEWLLHNAFITKVAMGELSYDNEEISEVTLTFRYDYAQVDVVNGDGKIPSS